MKVIARFNAQAWIDFSMEVEVPDDFDVDDEESLFEHIDHGDADGAFNDWIDAANRAIGMDAIEPYDTLPEIYEIEKVDE